MMSLACTLFFAKCNIEPVQAVYWMCLISTPEGLSFFLGIFIDSVSIFGKRGHILMAAALQITASIIIFTYPFNKDNIKGFVIVAVICNFGRAWLAPAIESIMVN